MRGIGEYGYRLRKVIDRFVSGILKDAQAAPTRASAVRVQARWDYQIAKTEYGWAAGEAVAS
ncbi:MAG: hypothetical protein HZA23_05365 [Nitrospirae bacterium]|nr:hypothetical protein [Nitrospirota bacterium]